MRKITIDENKKCPKCGEKENQIKVGYNRSGTQRCKCKSCGTKYTLNPKKHEYPEETKKFAIEMYYSGISGRGVGRALNMSKANVYNWLKAAKKQNIKQT